MSDKKYRSLVVELTSLILRHDELKEVKLKAEFDLKWRLTQLYEEVSEEDEQKFIDISGMNGQLMTTEQKQDLAKREKDPVTAQENKHHGLSGFIKLDNKPTDKKWEKSLYRRAVRRCHPDTLKTVDDDYREELVELYKNITESYENRNLDILMVESYKLFIKPKEVINEQIQILENSRQTYSKNIESIITSEAFLWSTWDDKMKENFLINFMKQRGIRFADKKKVKEILKRKVSKRKVGEKPKNKLQGRVKNKL